MLRAACFQALSWCCLMGILSAQDAAEKSLETPSLEQLLRVGWKYSPENMATAISIYRDLKAASPDDLNLQHAMILVAIRQQKYPEAKQLLRAAIEKSPHTLALRQTELWLLTVTKDYETALQTVTQLATDFNNPARAPALLPFAGFCGQVLGTWQGPLSKQLPKTVTGARLTELETTIVKHWPPEFAQAFVTAHRATLEKYQLAKTEFEAKRGDVAGQQEQARASDLETNQREQAEVQTKLPDLKAQSEKLTAEFEKTRDASTIQLQAARNQYNTLQGQYNTALAQALNLRAEAKTYRAQGAGPKNKSKNLADLAEKADKQAAMLESTCRSLQQQGVPVQAQIVAISNGLSKQAATFQSAYKKLDQEYRQLEILQKKLVTQSKLLEKPATGLNATTSQELAKLDDLATYVPYSLEGMKASLLKAALK